MSDPYPGTPGRVMVYDIPTGVYLGAWRIPAINPLGLSCGLCVDSGNIVVATNYGGMKLLVFNTTGILLDTIPFTVTFLYSGVATSADYVVSVTPCNDGGYYVGVQCRYIPGVQYAACAVARIGTDGTQLGAATSGIYMDWPAAGIKKIRHDGSYVYAQCDTFTLGDRSFDGDMFVFNDDLVEPPPHRQLHHRVRGWGWGYTVQGASYSSNRIAVNKMEAPPTPTVSYTESLGIAVASYPFPHNITVLEEHVMPVYHGFALWNGVVLATGGMKQLPALNTDIPTYWTPGLYSWQKLSPQWGTWYGPYGFNDRVEGSVSYPHTAPFLADELEIASDIVVRNDRAYISDLGTAIKHAPIDENTNTAHPYGCWWQKQRRMV